MKNLKFYIEIVGGKIKFYNNRINDYIIKDIDFPFLDYLFEKGNVFIGISASMNLHKSINIKDFVVKEVVPNLKGVLKLKENEKEIFSGNQFFVNFFLESTCGKKLRIYQNDFENIQLKENGENFNYEKMFFNEKDIGLEIGIFKKEIGIFIFEIMYKNYSSNGIKIQIKESNIIKYEICPEILIENYIIKSKLNSNKNYFIIPICIYDQYYNQKKYNKLPSQEEFFIKYPDNIVPLNPSVISPFSSFSFTINIPISYFGNYQISNINFFNQSIREYDFLPNTISPILSESNILYGYKKVKEGDEIFLKIILKDEFERIIPNHLCQKILNCNFSNSEINYIENIEDNIKKDKINDISYEDNNIILLKYIVPQKKGQFTFIPKINSKLTNSDISLKCTNCTFYVSNEKINKKYIKLYGDYYGKSYLFSSNENNEPLYISLDEENNSQITKITFVDDTGFTIINNEINIESAYLNNITLSSQINVAGFIILYLENKTRSIFSPFENYILNITFDDNFKFEIPIRFLYLDNNLNNIENENKENEINDFYVFFKQNSFIINASAKLYLFDIYGKDSKGTFIPLTKDYCNNIKFKINSIEDNNIICELKDNYISIWTEMKKIGIYKTNLLYNDKIISNQEITIISLPIIESLEPINSIDYKEEPKDYFTLLNVTIEKIPNIKFKMKDIFGNEINYQNIRNLFHDISIIEKNNMEVKLNLNGEIMVYSNFHIPGKQNLKLMLPNKKNYTIELNRISNQIDPLKSYASFKGNMSDYKVGNFNVIEITLRDSYSNIIFDDSFKNYINVYSIRDGDNEIYEYNLNYTYQNKFYFSKQIKKSGKYIIHVFIYDIELQCNGCNINFQSRNYEKNPKVKLIGNKYLIPLFPNSNYTHIINKKRNFVISVEFYDLYDNKVSNTKTYSILINNDDLIHPIPLCLINQNREEMKQIYKVCSSNEDNFKNLKNGEYYFEIGENKYNLLITDEDIDNSSNEVNIKYSKILSDENIIKGRNDKPGSLIIDLRNSEKKRFNVDINKLSVNLNISNSINLFYGPDKGLITILIHTENIGNYNIEIKYDNKLISNEYIYNNKNGAIGKIEKINNILYYKSGSVIQYLVKDTFNNNYISNSQNELLINEFINNAFQVYSDNDIYYHSRKSFNIKTGILSIIIDNLITGNIKISSVYNNNDSFYIKKSIIDNDHFHISLDKEKSHLNIIVLDSRYKKIPINELNDIKLSMKMTLIKTINDISYFIKEYELKNDSENYYFDYSNDNIINGDYLFIPYYNGFEISCQDCRLIKDFSINEINLKKTKIFTKEGYDNYLEKQEGMIRGFYKSSFPFFKINFFDNYNNLIIINNNIKSDFKLYSNNINIEINKYFSKNGNVYIYLNEEGRKKYENLSKYSKINLDIEIDNKKETFKDFILLNSITKSSDISNEGCSSNPIPNIINFKSIYTLRTNNELILELSLSGCDKQLKKIYNEKDISINNNNLILKIIPSEFYDNYIIFISSSISNSTNPYLVNLQFNDTKSDDFKILVLPSNINYKIEIEPYLNENEYITSDYKFIHFKLILKDNSNIIDDLSVNKFYNDIYLNVYQENNKYLPYKITYNSQNKFFVGEIPIISTEKITLKSNDNEITLNIKPSLYLFNSKITISENEKFTINLSPKDNFYNDIELKEKNVTIKYITYNPITNEKYELYLKANFSDNKYEFNLPYNTPIYDYYIFIPYLGYFEQICNNCFFINQKLSILYSVIGDNYYSHKFNEDLTLLIEKDISLPFYVFSSINSNQISSDLFNSFEINLNKRKLLYFGFKKNNIDNGNEIINLNNNKLTLYIKQYSLSNLTPSEEKSILYSNQNYIFENNPFGIYFYLEVRDSNNILTSEPFRIELDNLNGIVKQINLIQTSLNGIYLIIIPTTSLINTKFTIKFKETNPSNNFIYINSNPSFPTQIDFFNKEILDGNKLIKYSIKANDENGISVCDNRLNIFLTESVKNQNIKSYLIKQDSNCYYIISFIGKIKISSITGNYFSIDIINLPLNINTLNPFYSEIIINKSKVTKSNEEINLSINLKDNDNTLLDSEYSITNINLFIYKYISDSQYEYIEKIYGIRTMNYQFTFSELKLEKKNLYLFIPFLDNLQMKSKIIKFNDNYNENPNKFGVKMLKDNYWIDVNNQEIKLKYPFEFKVNLLNENNEIIKFNDNDEINCILLDDKQEKNIINFLIKKIDDFTFSISLKSTDLNFYLHLPKNNYYLLINNKNSNLNFISKIDYEDGLYQRTDFIGLKYNFPNSTFPEKFEVIQNTHLSSINSNENEFIKTTLCLIDDLLINDYLKINKISFSNEKCIFSYEIIDRGCFNIYSKCEISNNDYSSIFEYNNIESTSTTSIKTSFSFNLIKVKKIEKEFPDFIIGQIETIFYLSNNDNKEIKNIDNKNIRVYINKQLINNIDLISNENKLKIQIPYSEFNENSLFNEIQIFFIYGNNEQIYLNSLTKNIKKLQNDFSIDDTQIQIPLGIKAGENFSIYTIFKDINGLCYNNSINNLYIKIGNIEIKNYTLENINNINHCKIYKFNIEENLFTVSKIYEIELYNNSNLIKNEIKFLIESNIISPKNTYLTINNDQSTTFSVKAGEEFDIILKGKDLYNNEIDYYDLVNKIEFNLKNETKIINESEYTKKIRVNDNNNEQNIIISLNIKYVSQYSIEIFINNINFTNYHGIELLKIIPGDCSINYPNYKIIPIDNRINLEYYLGETIKIEIYCKDNLGNQIEKKGYESFSIIIKNNNIEIPNKVEFNKIYFSKFKISDIGNYTISVFLNGTKYYEEKEIKIKKMECEKNEIMCLDKKCVKKLSECDQNFMEEILKENFCKNSPSKPFKCKVNKEEKCVNDTSECDCELNFEKCNGMCIQEDLNYCKKNLNSNCKLNLISKFKNENITICNDGTCSIDNKCPNNFTCPLGYIKCQNKCILLGNKCKIEKNENCEKKNQIQCWDFSCRDSFEKCPKRITCFKGKYICPDGNCVDEESMCNQPIERNGENNQIQCNDMTFVKNEKFCIKNPSCDYGKHLCDNGKCEYKCSDRKCPLNKILCKNGFCAENIEKCPSVIFCPDGYIRCENNSCAKDKKECQFNEGNNLITCPVNKPILCYDYSCVDEESDCNGKIPICPPHIPFKCWNNECRKNIEDCPTKISCPDDYPVLCSDGTCQKANYYCIDKKIDDNNQEISSNLFRCYNGEERYSLLLCPTHTSCGKNIIKCWNGACVNNISNCPESPNQCTEENPFRCNDGTCRPDFKSCSTISVCPIETPVKCFDNSCRSSLKDCPEYQSCGNKVSCPDGTCASSYDNCNTLITCDNDKYKCYDGTCKEKNEECPQYPNCGDKVLCPNGECLLNRQNCKFFEPCTGLNTIRCSDNTCSPQLSNCNTEIGESCPIGYVQCSNGECKTSDSLCTITSCPSNKPYLCPEGLCVHDSSLCLNQNTGCPYNKPLKCEKGECVSDLNNCKEIKEECKDNKKLCPDGSCIDNNSVCPQKNGCPSDKPTKCLDGTCVNLNKESCSLPFCPLNTPYKCPNGQCVSRANLCYLEPTYDERTNCGDGMIMCYNGICVPSIDYCYPIKKCENDYVRCGDGTCRQEKSLCPLSNNCPSTHPYYCGDGHCAFNADECESTCPHGFKICQYDGKCYKCLEGEICDEKEFCKPLELYNGCPSNNSVRCYDGRCVYNESDCYKNPSCPNDKPYLCNNGECNDNCDNILYSECKENEIHCPNGKCVSNDKLYIECLNEINCPIIKPYRCSNGECVESKNDCEINKYCQNDKPYICSDGSCINPNKENCKILPPCDNYKTSKYQCPKSGFCVDKESDCSTFKNYCPRSTPIKCEDGGCATSIKTCQKLTPKPKCTPNEFYCIAQSKCVTSQNYCIGNIRASNQIISRRLLKEKSNKENNQNSQNSENSENGCPKNKISCYDGTCTDTYEKCPSLPSCPIGYFRCPNGGCNKNISECENPNEIQCNKNNKKCIDGLCRSDCSKIKFNGCDINQFLCSNGLCVNDELECIGMSMCDDYNEPYRCINGKCVSDLSKCPFINRLSFVYDIEYTFAIYDSINFDFAFDDNGNKIGSLFIPGNAFNMKNKNNLYGKIYLNEISGNFVNNINLYPNNSTFIFNISSSLIGSDGILSYENSVLSPIFNISSNDIYDDFIIPGLIKIEHNIYSNNDLNKLNFDFYCLAKLKGDFKNGKWECIERKKNEDQNTFSFKSTGIYTIIIYPYKNKNDNEKIENKNFFVHNLRTILIVLLIIIFLIAITFYIFSRIIRYREKYHQSLQKMEYLKQQKKEYESMSTDVFGQTLGDNILGLVYSKNPSFMLNVLNDNNKTLEDEVEELMKQCNNVENQNIRLQKNIDEVMEKYNKLSSDDEF